MLFYHSISFPNGRFVPVHCISLVLSFFRGDISDTHSNLQSVPIVDSSVHLVHNQVHLSLKARCISRCICSNYQVAIFFCSR